ncbi:MAG: hypothetical protein WD512_09975, partial [Candidatus Paceibacterota bacterium]
SADSPFIDYNIVDRCISKFKESDLDYLSNTINMVNGKWEQNYNGFPLGFAVEVFTFYALRRAWCEGKEPSDREHVTEYIFHNPQIFKLGCVTNPVSVSDMRLVVDYYEDYELVKKIIENFPDDKLFTLEKLVLFLNNHPEIRKINANIRK